jgi:plasmid stabilization system protein ParE
VTRRSSALVLRPLARRDIEAAAVWYEEQSPGLGRRFLDAVEATLGVIRAGPERYARLYRDVRRAGVERFPYGVFYVVRGETVHVIACVHGRRHPRRWQSRARGV